MLRWTLAVNKMNDGTVGETVRKMLGISPARWSEVGRKIKRIIELASAIVKSHLRLALRITEARKQRISAKLPKTAVSLDISKQRRRENRGASLHQFRPAKIYRRLPKSR